MSPPFLFIGWNIFLNYLGRKNRQAEKVEEQPRVQIPQQGHNSPSSQQPTNTTYIIRTGFQDKLKAEIKEELDKISKLDLFIFFLY